MPRNKRESFIYSVIMCFTMVLWMSMYNVTLHMGHLSLETIREGWIGFPFAFVYAFLFDWFIVSGPAQRCHIMKLPVDQLCTLPVGQIPVIF